MAAKSARRVVSGLLGLLAFSVVGCATSEETAAIRLGQLHQVTSRDGRILLRTLKDMRPANHRNGIGQKRHFIGAPGGFVYHSGDGSLEEVLTQHVAATLRHVGYAVEVRDVSVRSDAIRCDGILEGDIENFWMNMYIRGWAKARFAFRLIDPKTDVIVWEDHAQGIDQAHVGMGSREGFEQVITLTLTKALNEAARKFSSHEFYRHVKK